jgi:Ni/Fe-hydrogenase subunit HybB-like protein
MVAYLTYWKRMIGWALRGSQRYYLWQGALLAVVLVGLVAYHHQWVHGFAVTNLSDQVSWGAYIANFTYLVGIAAAAVLLVIPSYLYHRKDVKEVVLVGELLALSAIIGCLLFVTVDLGHPERVMHMMPVIGTLNFPDSILAWDIIVLSGYLFLNLHIPGYLLYKKYKGEEPTAAAYLPFVFLSIGWAISIHTVTAFLYAGFGGRPFWNSAILAPRFLVSAFVSGPALLIIIFTVMRRTKTMAVAQTTLDLLKRIITFTLPLNYFLLGCEVFGEFYTDSLHVTSAKYLFFGLDGHGLLVPYIWGSLAMGVTALVIFLTPKFRANSDLVVIASALCVVGIWIEKGMGLLIPGFIPTPLGDLVEYTPALTEIFVSAGIWAFGAFIFTAMAKVAVAIQKGELRA